MEIELTYRLSEIMYDRNISVRQLELISGVSKSMINDIANGNHDTTVKALCKIMEALNVSFDEIVTYKIVK